MNRRKFVSIASATTALALCPQVLTSCAKNELESIGVQLFSLPKLLEEDFRKGIELLANIGFKEIEMYGPFPFSVDEIKQQWSSITPMLGFSGSGYFGHTPEEVKAILDEYEIKATSTHTDLATLQTRMPQLGEAAHQLGLEYVGIASIPPEMRTSLDDYKKMADTFNTIGENAKKEGLKFAYHNHGYGLKEVDGQIPLQVILEQTDPNLVFFEMDIYWTIAGGGDPMHYLESYPNRYHLMHVKDMKEEVHFSGDGGNPSQWTELFPYMTTAGNGIIDIGSIIPLAKKMGVKHFYVEQDMVEYPEIALKESFNYLNGLKT